MATSIVLSLDTRRSRQDGSYPLLFRLTHNSNTTGIKSGLWLLESDWDAKKRIVRASYKGAESVTRLNNMLAKKKAGMMDILNRLEDRGELRFLTLAQVKEYLSPSHATGTVYSYTEHLITDLIKANRIGTARTYKCVLGIIKAFTNNHDLSFNALNGDFLKRLEIWHLSKEGNGLNSLSVYMRTLRAIYNKAIADGVAEKEAYPFDHYTIRSSKARKRAIRLDAIKKIVELELPIGLTLGYHRNVFLMSFYLQGMPFADLARLRLNNIIDGRIKYDRQKTDKPYDVKITPQLENILQGFITGKERDDFILPVIKRQTPTEQYKDVLWAIQRYNKNLKKIATLAGIEENLTSYVARHSFASLADEMEVPLTGIRDMLGHERASTTEAYLSDLRKSKIDEYQDRVFGGM
jgi:site-specific recombinase XerD